MKDDKQKTLEPMFFGRPFIGTEAAKRRKEFVQKMNEERFGLRTETEDSQEYVEALRHLSQTRSELGQFDWVLDLTVYQADSLLQLKNAVGFFVVAAAIAGFAAGLSIGLLL